MALNKPTAAEVIALTGTTVDSAVVTAIIDDAALMANACLEPLADDIQKSALKWLSAHLVSSSGQGEGQVSSEKLGDASITYARGTLGRGVSGTMYGQQAIALAPCLAYLGQARATIEVI